jgi:phosphopantothenoylcysteine decarboxylase/phosphopantothenate--cysteine ligase
MNILVGVTGGIAAYKAAYLVRLFKKNGDDVKVVMTEGATRFITPLTMMTLSGNRVYTEMFPETADYDYAHIELSKWADVFVIAPATANTIAKIAAGIADNLLTSAVLAYPQEKQLFIAPAMNTAMFEKDVTKDNLTRIGKYAIIIGPVQGRLACGDQGMGAMTGAEDIFARISGTDTTIEE